MKNKSILNLVNFTLIILMINISSCGPSEVERREKEKAKQEPIASNDSIANAVAEQQSKADSISSATMPHFPWPPPKSSASVKIPRDFLIKSNQAYTLNQVAKEFEVAMDKVGYTEFSYYYVPAGFAIVSQLEQIQPDGTPVPGSKRYNVEFQKQEITSLESYIKALFIPNPGYFRVIVFIFTTKPYTESAKKMEKITARELVHNGLDKLPKKMGNITYSVDFECTAKIYEFEQKSINSKVVLLDPSPVKGKDHLIHSNIWKVLSR